MKKCFKCGEVKPLSSFHKHKAMKDGHLNKCSTCVVADVAKWRLDNPECRKKEHERRRDKEGFPTIEEWRKIQSVTKKGRKVILAEYSEKRRNALSGYTSNELDIFVYQEAIRLRELRKELIGGDWHVDHIVPLNHKEACGLHSAFNFQVVPASWNVKKGNRNMDKYWSGY